MRNSDIAKFETRAEHNTELWQYAQRQPLAYDKTTKETIAQHLKEHKKEYRGDIKIRQRQPQADNASGISSENNKISKAVSSRKPKKPQVGTSRSRKSSATPVTSIASSTAASSATSSTVTPTISKSKRNKETPDYFGFESSVSSVGDPKTMPAPKRQKRHNRKGNSGGGLTTASS